MKIIPILLISLLCGILLSSNLPFFAITLVLTPFLFSIFSRRIELGIYFTTIWVPLQYFITPYYIGILPQHFVWIDEIIIIVMFFVTVTKVVSSGNKFKFSNIDCFVLVFIAYSIITSSINLVNPLIALLGIRGFLQYYLLYFVIKNSAIKEHSYKIVIKILVISLAIQIPISIYQFFSWRPVYFNPLTGGYVNKWNLSYYDAVVGTFGTGAANNFGYLLMIAIFILFGAYFILKQRKYLFFLTALIIPLVLTQSRGAYFLFLIIFVYVFKNIFLKDIRKTAVILAIFSFCFMGLTLFYFNYSGFKFDDFFKVERILKEQTTISPRASGRIIGLKVANDILSDHDKFRLIGAGPGTFSSSTGMALASPLYLAAVNKLNSNRCITETDAVPMIAEFGYFGLVIYLLMIIVMIKRNSFVFRSTSNQCIKALTFGGRGALLTFLFAGFLVRAWEAQYIAFYIWLYLGIIESVFFHENNMERK